MSQEWISVNDKMPDKSEFVLIANSEVTIPAIMFDGVWYAPDKSMINPETVSHWMPLPELGK